MAAFSRRHAYRAAHADEYRRANVANVLLLGDDGQMHEARLPPPREMK